MRNKLIAVLFSFAVLAVGAQAQTEPTPAPQVNAFSVTANAVSLPGSNSSTLAGSLVGMNLKITPNFNLEQVNFITSAAQTNAFLAGGSYTLTALSKKLNNASENLAGYDFRFSLHGDVGEIRAAQVGLAALFGAQVDYAIKGSQTYSLAVRVDDLFANKGLPHKNNLVVAVGPTIHF